MRSRAQPPRTRLCGTVSTVPTRRGWCGAIRPQCECVRLVLCARSLWRFVESTVGLRMRTSSSKPWETAHKQRMQEHDRIHQNNLCTTDVQPREACNGCRLRIYRFTDFTPSLPLFDSTRETRIYESSRRRDSCNRPKQKHTTDENLHSPKAVRPSGCHCTQSLPYPRSRRRIL